MDPINHYSIENYAERHRADFDLHEPRPELWEVLAQRLEATAASPDQPRLSIVAEAPQPVPSAPVRPAPALRAPRRPGRWQLVGVALGLLTLLVAASLGERWKASHRASVASGTLAAARRAAPDAALYLGREVEAVTASEGGPNGNARLDTAVHGMERYYAAQLADRQDQLSQLLPDSRAEWAQDLVGLDSSYQQLKRELPRHPQPEVVLTAMNRNLQNRLDILDQQLELHGTDQLAQGPGGSGSEYVLADSRGVAETTRPHHAH